MDPPVPTVVGTHPKFTVCEAFCASDQSPDPLPTIATTLPIAAVEGRVIVTRDALLAI